MKKIYICGKVTGDPNYKEKFSAAEGRFYAIGYYPVNPTAFISSDEPWPSAMRKAISAMLLCDGVALLPDWKKSKGAKLEVKLAKKLEITIKTFDEWRADIYAAE